MIKGTIHKADTVNHYTPIKQTNIYKAETRRNMRKTHKIIELLNISLRIF